MVRTSLLLTLAFLALTPLATATTLPGQLVEYTLEVDPSELTPENKLPPASGYAGIEADLRDDKRVAAEAGAPQGTSAALDASTAGATGDGHVEFVADDQSLIRIDADADARFGSTAEAGVGSKDTRPISLPGVAKVFGTLMDAAEDAVTHARDLMRFLGDIDH